MPTRQLPFVNKSRKKSLAAVLPHKKKMIGIRPTINTHDMHLKLQKFMVALIHKEARGMNKSLLLITTQSYALESNAFLPDWVFERILEKCQFTRVVRVPFYLWCGQLTPYYVGFASCLQ